MSDISPKNFVFDAPEGIRRSRDEREYIKANAHLALHFPVPELRYYFHPTFPGRVTLVQAQSHNFKTEWMNFWAKTAAVELSAKTDADETKRGVIIKISTEDAIEGLVEAEIAGMGGGKLDDISVGVIENPQEFLRAETTVGGLPIVHIGESLGMDNSNAAKLYLSNIVKLIDYVRKDHFAVSTPIAAIFLDYLQTLPIDPANRVNNSMVETRRNQVMHDMDSIRRAAKYFNCPVVLNAQSKQDEQLSTFNKSIKLPGYWDVQESSYPSQRTDFLYSLWMPKMHYPQGEWVGSNAKKEFSKWNFCVKPNALWIQCHKHKKYTNVGASFPMLVSENGNVSFDKDLYENITRMERI